MKKSPWVLLLFILLGGLLGGVLGEILRVIAPQGTIQTLFSKAPHIGIPNLTVDLFLLTFTFGFTLKINLLTILGVFLGIYLYKQA
ncbi:MAG: DUF4321 domain-containing protein [Nitrospirota bacterium]|nr:DUF4321 domain-containing protein [Nitrospirota bacterium]MDE3119677.1 DUF4321 domain-containing protein [Nitrospirota bacterium]MDE3226187.1 DUF4321 domain-containing protein [Nitrospirota bacterium]MDE3243931.1 DUF4321 domain-containing protein [Nitrospirota bacterium]